MEHNLRQSIGVSGATGFIGKRLAERLSAMNVFPVFFGRTNPGLGDFVAFDFAGEKQPILPPLENFVHLAAYIPENQSDSNLMACESVNGFGTMRLLESLDKTHLKRFVNVSSCHIWDPTHSGTIKNAYEGSKLSGELFVNAYAARYEFEAINLRLSYVYGPGMKHGRMFRIFLEKALANKPIRLFNKGKDEIFLIYYDDVADAILSVLKADRLDGTFEISDTTPYKTEAIARAVLEVVDSKSQLEFVDGKPGPSWRPNPSETLRPFGFVPKTTLKTGIQALIEADYSK